jgi:hypothetical protein
MVVVGTCVATCGAADRVLGLLAMVLGEWDAAEAHLDDALALNQRTGARSWTARTQLAQAELLRRRGRPGADRLTADALALATSVGAHGITA